MYVDDAAILQRLRRIGVEDEVCDLSAVLREPLVRVVDCDLPRRLALSQSPMLTYV